MHLESRGTFQVISHEGPEHTYLVMTAEGSHLFVLSFVTVHPDSSTLLIPLGNFNTMSKVRAAITKHRDNLEDSKWQSK
jgi:hypothetical protein